MKNKIIFWVFTTFLTLSVYLLIYFIALKEYDFGSFFGEMTVTMLIVVIIGMIVGTFFLIFLGILIPMVFWEIIKSMFKKK